MHNNHELICFCVAIIAIAIVAMTISICICYNTYDDADIIRQQAVDYGYATWDTKGTNILWKLPDSTASEFEGL